MHTGLRSTSLLQQPLPSSTLAISFGRIAEHFISNHGTSPAIVTLSTPLFYQRLPSELTPSALPLTVLQPPWDLYSPEASAFHYSPISLTALFLSLNSRRPMVHCYIHFFVSYSPTCSVFGFLFPHTLISTCHCQPFSILVILVGEKWHHVVVLIRHLPDD